MYIKKILWTIALLGLVVCGYFAFTIYITLFSPNTKFNNKEAVIFIYSGSDYTDVREDLKPLLKDISSFDMVAKRKKYTDNIKTGRYIISNGMNNNEIINTLRIKKTAVSVSFNNQHSISLLAQRIARQIEPDSAALHQTMIDPSFLSENGFNQNTALAMYIPNSYQIYWDTSAEEFRNRMLQEYKKFWNPERIKKAKAINKTPVEVMTLASIVHEESKQAEEQPTVAGVYLNRLRTGMKLDADPTLKYAAYQLPEYQNTIIKRVLNKHKNINSPYNTYRNAGLPPGPIAMPDLSAINAVLKNEKHDYLYFVADAKKIGHHKFAKTLQQHNRNAREYHSYLTQNRIFN